jgi:hypothetical protein
VYPKFLFKPDVLQLRYSKKFSVSSTEVAEQGGCRQGCRLDAQSLVASRPVSQKNQVLLGMLSSICYGYDNDFFSTAYTCFPLILLSALR